MDECLNSDRLDAFHKLNHEFHRTIYGAAGSKRLASTIDNLFQTVGIAQHVFEDIGGYAKHSNEEHTAILAALAAHDAVAAEARMKAHIEDAGQRRISHLQSTRNGKHIV